MDIKKDAYQLLRWQVEAGANEAIQDHPVNRYDPASRKEETESDVGSMAAPRLQASSADAASSVLRQKEMSSGQRGFASPGLNEAPGGMALHGEKEAASSRKRAEAARNLEELREALETLDSCPIKATATHLVFADGNPQASVMLVGEAPGAEEDRQGLPFVGMSGKLLDRMLAAIGLDRDHVYISNILPWRPPGNRNPSPAEIALCLPFVERHIELVGPKILVFVGGVAAKTLLGCKESIGKLRGRWLSYHSPGLARPIDALATFHPAYLLRSPGQKRKAWQDFLALETKLKTLS